MKLSGYSIVATSYNDEEEISSFLENMLNQTLEPSEIIIADGGSTDSTVHIIQQYVDSYAKIKLVTGGRLNIAQGYNLAIRSSSYPLIGVVGIGNFYENDYFKKLLESFECGRYDIIYSPIRGYNCSFFSTKYIDTFLNGEYGQRQVIPSNHGSLIKKDVFDRFGLFYEGFIYSGEDTEFYLRITRKGVRSFMRDDAVVRWKTPQSFKEYVKQVENYSIAAMQINSNKYILRITVTRLFPLIYLLTILLFISFKYKWIVMLCFLIFEFKVIIRIKNNENIFLKICEYYLYPFFYIKNFKYMRRKYKVVDRHGS